MSVGSFSPCHLSSFPCSIIGPAFDSVKQRFKTKLPVLSFAKYFAWQKPHYTINESFGNSQLLHIKQAPVPLLLLGENNENSLLLATSIWMKAKQENWKWSSSSSYLIQWRQIRVICSNRSSSRLHYKSSYHWQSITFKTFQAWGSGSVYLLTNLFKPENSVGTWMSRISWGSEGFALNIRISAKTRPWRVERMKPGLSQNYVFKFILSCCFHCSKAIFAFCLGEPCSNVNFSPFFSASLPLLLPQYF